MKNSEFKYIDLRIDWSFKYVYGTRGNEDLLLNLLDAIMPEKHICHVELREQEQMPDNKDERKAVFDVNCTAENGDSFVIEMQNAEQDDFAHRLVYYSGFPIRQQVRSGEKIYRFAPVYVIGIMNFLMPEAPVNDNVINTYSIRNDNNPGNVMLRDLQFITVELPKIGSDPSKLSAREKQLYLIRNAAKMSRRPEEFQSEEFDKLFNVINFASMSPENQEIYESELRAILNHNSEIATALRKGEAKGARDKAIETARNMKAAGIPAEIISQCTGLTLEQVAEL